MDITQESDAVTYRPTKGIRYFSIGFGVFCIITLILSPIGVLIIWLVKKMRTTVTDQNIELIAGFGKPKLIAWDDFETLNQGSGGVSGQGVIPLLITMLFVKGPVYYTLKSGGSGQMGVHNMENKLELIRTIQDRTGIVIQNLSVKVAAQIAAPGSIEPPS